MTLEYLMIGILAFLLILERLAHIVESRAAARERDRLLDRVQARDLPEYKTFAQRPETPRQEAPVQDEEPQFIEYTPDLRPGHYPDAMAATRELLEE